MARYVLTLIAAIDDKELMEALVTRVEELLLELGARPDEPDWLAPGKACDLYFSTVTPEYATAPVRRLIADGFSSAKVDVIFQEAADRRKRLIVADLESTLIENEMLDELAEFIGAKAKVSEITRRAMNGEIDFATALKERVGLFAGLPVPVLFEAAKRIRLMPGAAVFIATAKAHGAYVAIVTGGFTFFARQVQAMLNIDAVLANELIVEDGKLTGAVREPILTRDEKRAALLRLAAQQGVPLRSTLALGDGANDLPMLDAAGLGVAFHAKPAVVEQARVHVDHGDLTSLLYAQGYRISEFARP